MHSKHVLCACMLWALTCMYVCDVGLHSCTFLPVCLHNYCWYTLTDGRLTNLPCNTMFCHTDITSKSALTTQPCHCNSSCQPDNRHIKDSLSQMSTSLVNTNFLSCMSESLCQVTIECVMTMSTSCPDTMPLHSCQQSVNHDAWSVCLDIRKGHQLYSVLDVFQGGKRCQHTISVYSMNSQLITGISNFYMFSHFSPLH